MEDKKPYVDFMFLGINSFIAELKKAGTEHKVIKDTNTHKLLNEKGSIFNKDTDTIKLGHASKDGKEFYFIEFGMKVTKSVISYIVFLYKDHPTLEMMKATTLDIEPLVNEYLKGVGMQMPNQ